MRIHGLNVIGTSCVLGVVGLAGPPLAHADILGGVELGGLTDHLFVFTDGSEDANWQSSSKGYVGDVAVAGGADLRTSGDFAYAGTIRTGGSSLDAWNRIVDNNSSQASASLNQGALLTDLSSDLDYAFFQIDALTATSGYTSRSSSSLNGLNTQNGIAETYVINVTSDFKVSDQINITGDASDAFVLRWDSDADAGNGYNGQVKFQSGGAIVPLGGLAPGNFLHVAGDINASGGGDNPSSPFPQGPRHDGGQGDLIDGGSDFSGGGFFTGFWLTTGDPSDGETSSLSNGVFVGGWYTSSSKFSLTSGTSGVHAELVPAPGASLLLAGLMFGSTLRSRRRTH